ncbi:hypothetical protein [Fructobacillus tropaeoli]|uniref:hypothetical protein n=1 Tax=Fructobacillus tropaeoli TaxID=709323 RepID=UPI001940EFF0|nr:hypothetical protein [Fructobacillus tropaeoli]GIC70593.1 hypothetical protein FT12353_12680 [Fructobacillus tropaeoli]
MTKKFTEEEYQKIVDCFDELKEKYNMGLMNPNLLIQMQDELFGELDFIDEWKEIFAIANPTTRDCAHDQFVEKEKKHFWRNKKRDEYGNERYLVLKDSVPLPIGIFKKYPFTESEIREWGYNPDMYDKEEVK